MHVICVLHDFYGGKTRDRGRTICTPIMTQKFGLKNALNVRPLDRLNMLNT